MINHAPPFLHDSRLRLLFFGGKGGVGKTTCAAATALRRALSFPKASILIASTDPAHSLTDCLSDLPLPGNLAALEIDSRKCLAAFKEKHDRQMREIASRGTFFDDEDISRILNLSLPGLDELMAFLEICGWVENETYDCIVVDTAPTGHTLRLLAMPELIRKWITALDALLAKHRYMKQLFRGSYRSDELDMFLLELSDSVNRMETLLADPKRCRFIPVMLAETMSISETVMLLDELKRLKISVSDIVINSLYPENSCTVCSNRRAGQERALGKPAQRLSGYSLWGAPLCREEIRGQKLLEAFWDDAYPLNNPPQIRQKNGGQERRTSPKSAIPPGRRPLRAGGRNPQSHWGGPGVEMPGNQPSPETKLLLFAGKGGVGKTTLACATAIRMAQELSGKEVFIFSTDPAHSLSVCLDSQIGPEPTSIAPGLAAMEIDARAEFEALKNQYAKELEKFLGAISPNLDLAFDRDVMERVMDLSPPGLDEIMALASVMEFLAQGRFQVFILDSAPTGHLIRLLEAPELIDQWLKLFFSLFLKYNRVFRLPEISKRMVRISKDLKRLRSLLRDPDQSALYAVTILTEMAFEETRDLVEACKRMRVHIPMLFFNLATAESPCPLCSAIHKRESNIMKKFERSFPGKHKTLVYQRGEPRGLEALGELGEALYAPAEGRSLGRLS